MDGRMELPPILQDLFPYWGLCPERTKSMVGQGLTSPPFPPHLLASDLYLSINSSVVASVGRALAQQDKMSWQTTKYVITNLFLMIWSNIIEIFLNPAIKSLHVKVNLIM